MAKVWDEEIQSRVFHSFHMKPIEKRDLELPKTGSKARVIDLMDHELTTRERIEEFKAGAGTGSWCRSGEGYCEGCGV